MASIAVRDEPGWITFSLDGKFAYPRPAKPSQTDSPLRVVPAATSSAVPAAAIALRLPNQTASPRCDGDAAMFNSLTDDQVVQLACFGTLVLAVGLTSLSYWLGSARKDAMIRMSEQREARCPPDGRESYEDCGPGPQGRLKQRCPFEVGGLRV